jgi:hypothetical protein
LFTFTLFMKLFALVNVVTSQAVSWGCMMVGKAYLSRQMTALMNFARQTNNPELSALLVQKAARLKSQADEIAPRADVSPKAPDVQPVPPIRKT